MAKSVTYNKRENEKKKQGIWFKSVCSRKTKKERRQKIAWQSE